MDHIGNEDTRTGKETEAADREVLEYIEIQFNIPTTETNRIQYLQQQTKNTKRHTKRYLGNTHKLCFQHMDGKKRDDVMRMGLSTAFRPHTIYSWNRPIMEERRDLLTQTGIYLDPNRKWHTSEVVIDVLYSDYNNRTNDAQTQEKTQDTGKEEYYHMKNELD